MPAFDQKLFVRPWIDGVAIAAGLVSDAVFHVAGVTPAAVDAALAAVASHDALAPADLASRVVVADDSTLRPATEGADWIDGLSDALCRLAATIDFGTVPTTPSAVAVTGVPVTRNEWDGQADVTEISRLVSDGLGLTVAGIWPSAATMSDLAGTGQAGTIFALPDGRAVAAAIAARTGARVIDVDLPLGFDGTVRFMAAASRATGRDARSDEFVQAALRRVTPRFEWVVPHNFMHHRVGLVGSASFVAAMNEFLLEVGCDVCGGALTGGLSQGVPVPGGGDPDPDEPFDLVIGNADATDWCSARAVPFLETGWPGRGFHCFYPRPSLGFDGAAAILQDAANRMNIFEILQSWNRTVTNEEDRQPNTSQGHVPSATRPA